MRTTISFVTAVLLGSVAACDRGPTEPEQFRPGIRVTGPDEQVAPGGAWIPLAVRVLDGHHRGVPDVTVHWKVTSGEGEVAGSPEGSPSKETSATTNANGIATIYGRIVAIGRSTLTASVPRSGSSPVTVTTALVRPGDVVVHFGPMFDCNEPSGFAVGNKLAREVTVPVGATVQWVYMEWASAEWGSANYSSCRARITSTSVPPGGQGFDSGVLRPKDRFQFVATVPGTWHYVDAINGGTSTLTVTAP